MNSMNPDDGPQPSQSDVFAASQPFTASSEPFLGIDGFNPAGPMPLVAPLQQSPIKASCLDVHRSLSVFLDGELTLPQANAVSAHLTVCGPCQSAQAFQMQLRTTVASKALDPMPEDVRARITQALGFEQDS
jgi:anti-sigma factor (TIGR02949 family)